MKLRLFLVVGIFFLFSQAMAQDLPSSKSNSPGLSGKIEIEVSSSGIFLHADNADIKDVLAELSRTTGVVLTAGPQINAKISLDMKDADLEQILKKICANRAVVYTLDPESGAYTIVNGYGFGATQEDATSIIPTTILI